MKIIAQALFVFFAMTLTIVSCTKSTTIGADLLEQDQASINFTDTITLVTSTHKENSIKVYAPVPQEARIESYIRHLCSNFTDPIFGTTESSIYAQFRVDQNLSPNFEGLVLDSLVLSMVYDSSGIYGDIEEMHEFEVYRITEDLGTDLDLNYNSDQSYQVGTTPIGTAQFIPRISDSLMVKEYRFAGDSSAVIERTLAPHLRITLDTTLGKELLAIDNESLGTNDAFLPIFKGLYIKDLMNTNSMLSFNLFSSTSGITIYFHEEANPEKRAQYQFRVTGLSTRLSTFKTELSPTVSSAISNPATGDSILYLQGMAGPYIKVDIPYADAFRDQIAVNKAELEFTVANQQDMNLFPPPEQIVLSQRNENGEFSVISDVNFASARVNASIGLFDFFGGSPEEANGVQTYSMNISAELQRIIDGDTDSSTFYISVYPKHEKANGVILYGAEHPQYPAKLKLTYTNLN